MYQTQSGTRPDLAQELGVSHVLRDLGLLQGVPGVGEVKV